MGASEFSRRIGVRSLTKIPIPISWPRKRAPAALSLLRWFGMGRKSSQKAKAAASVNYQRPWC